jgi:hypothetical protein
MDDPVSIFKTWQDYTSWAKYEAQNELITDLTDDERRRATTGIRCLRSWLGEDFLKHAAIDGNPIFFWFFRNSAPHARRSLIRLTEKLTRFQDATGFGTLISRLKNRDKSAEALTVIGTAANFSRVGFVVSFDPKLKDTGKVPDLLLLDPDSGQEIYVEVSRLRKGGLQELNSQVHNAIFTGVLDAVWSVSNAGDVTTLHVLPYVHILECISLKELPRVLERIREAIFETARSHEYRELKIGTLVELAVSPANDHSKAKAWANERKMRDLVEAPPIDLDNELTKAIGKVRKELDQLPTDKPGIIAIPTSENMLFFAFHPQEIISEIAGEARYHPNLLCVALSHSVMDGNHESSVASLGDHAFATTRHDLSTERTALVMNESFSLPLSESTIARVRKAFLSGSAV